MLLAFAALWNGRWRPDGDGAVDLVIGRRIARGLGFTHPDGWEEPLMPALSYVAAAGFRLFGEDSVMLPLLAVAACWLGSLVCVFLWLRRVAGRPTAVLLTAVLGVSEAWLSFGIAVRSDLPFAAGTAATLLGLEWATAASPHRRRRLAGAAALLAGLALMALTRSVFVLVVGSLGIGLFAAALRSQRWWWAAALAAVGPVAAAVALWRSPAVGADAGILLRRLGFGPGGPGIEPVLENVTRLFSESLAEAVFALDLGPLCTVLLSGMLLVGFGLAVRGPGGSFASRCFWAVLLASLGFTWVVFLSHDRYMLPVLPLLLLGGWKLLRWVEGRALHLARGVSGRGLPAASGLAAPAVVLVAVLMNIIDAASMYQEQRSTEPLTRIDDGQMHSLARDAARMRRELPTQVVLVANKNPAELAYWADRRVLAASSFDAPLTPVPDVVHAYGELGASLRSALRSDGFRETDAVPGWEGPPTLRPWTRGRPRGGG